MLVGLATTSVSVVAAACATPSQPSLDALFKPAVAFGQTDRNLGTENVVGHVLSQNAGIKAFLNEAMGNVLTTYYQSSPLKAQSNKLDTWNNAIDATWNTIEQSAKNSYRNNYEVHIQTDTLDSMGGTRASWRTAQMDQRVLADFAGMVFANNHLHLTDDNGNVISQPSKSALEDPANWPKLKFTEQVEGTKFVSNPTTKQAANNDQEMFAEIQSYVVRQWIAETNPNILARVVFRNETPKVGFNAIFNSDLNAVTSPSYEAMVFSPIASDDPTRNATGSFNEMMIGTKSLDKYINPTNSKNTYGIDIPGYLSGDGSAKLSVDSLQMFTALDTPFSAAYINQYLRDVLSTTYSNDLLGSTPSASGMNTTDIMANFIKQTTSTDKASAWARLDWTTNKNSSKATAKKSFNLFATGANTVANNYYDEYPKLEDGTDKITDVIMPQTTSNQFIFTRGKDGVHIIGIDGGTYYLSSTGRDIDKQMQYLMFRTLYKTMGYPESKYDYTFDVSAQAATYLNNNQSELLYNAFSDALTKSDSFINQPQYAALKSAFVTLQAQVDSYVKAVTKARQAQALHTAVTDLRTKMIARDDTYVTNDQAGEGYKNGIAGKLPDVQAGDGSFPQLEYYYILMAKDLQLTTTTPNYDTQGKDGTAGTRAFFTDLVQSTQQALLQAATTLATNLKLIIDPGISAYSQVVTVASQADSALSLPLNMALQAGLALAPTTNAIKNAYFQKDAEFTNFYDMTTGQIKATGYSDTIKTAIQKVATYDYGRKLLAAQTDHAYYGTLGKTNNMDAYNKLLQTALTDQSFKTDQTSATTLDYYSYLYTFAWLLSDDLTNFKRILSSQVVVGVPAFVSWTVPTAAQKYTNTTTSGTGSTTSTTTVIDDFATNPNWWWGSLSDFLNAGEDSTPDASNNLTDPYAATMDDDATKFRFGFNGLSTQGDGKTNSALDSVLYTEFAMAYGETGTQQQQDQTGALYWYGDNVADVIAYAKANLTTTRAQDQFVNYLVSNVGVNVTPEMQNSSTDPAARLTAIESWLNTASTSQAYLFKQFKGYIGENKSETSVAASVPIITSDGTQSLPTYAEQVNAADVADLSGSWTTNEANRLHLSIGEFLALVSQQAMDASTQSAAVSYLIAQNGGSTPVGDKRLYDALTSRWAKTW